MNIDATLAKRKILITCGTGGVGKTTISAALALRAAIQGRKAVVITIDPAKRLATSLGLTTLGDHPTDLTHHLHEAFAKAKAQGHPTPPEIRGKFAALMPDTHRTFEDLIQSLTTKPELAQRIIQNPIFQILTREFSGSNEYMALQRLYALNQMAEYDCIILDTPPSRNTLAFLDAPTLLARLFEERLIRWLVLPANKLVSAGMRKALGILEKLTGSGFMTHLFDLGQGLFEVQVEFAKKLKQITQLLESDSVGFLLVAGPNPEAAEEIGHFIGSVQEHRFHFDGVALNRTLGYLGASAEEQPQGDSVSKAFEILKALQRREEKAAAAILKAVSQSLGQREAADRYAKLPELARDVHSVEDLFHVAMALGPIHSSASRAAHAEHRSG